MSELPLSIRHVTRLSWGFDAGPPFARVGRLTHLFLDPCEGYAHDTNLARDIFLSCSALFPVGVSVELVLLPFDAAGRQNGETHLVVNWEKKDELGRGALEPVITLYGKRIPIHPAMTRYLVAHEYGHVVHEVLARRLFKGDHPGPELDKAYAELRGMKDVGGYGPGSWHASIFEVFANDFRVLVCGAESEYWPHPGIPRPDSPEAERVREWWTARRAEMSPEREPKAP